MFTHTSYGFSPEVVEEPQIFFRDAHILANRAVKNTAQMTGGKNIAV
jgi:hypothetical protein